MRLNKVLIILFVTTLAVGCKKADSKISVNDVTEDESIDQIPKVSDEHFDNALKAYEADNKTEAAKLIHEGVLALDFEAKDVVGIHKVNLQMAIEQLNNIAGRLENNEGISEEGLKEAIIKAEINIEHEYLSTTEDIYVLLRPENVAPAITKRYLSLMLSNLKVENENTKEGAKKDSETLLKEGESIEKELVVWELKAKAYTQKANQYFKTYSPEKYNSFIDQ